MRAVRFDGRSRAAVFGAILLALPLGSAARAGEQRPQGVVGFTDAAGIVGSAAQIGDVAAGLIVIDGQTATLDCLDIVEGRDDTHTVYARYQTGAREPLSLQIASHVQGSTEAMAAVVRGSTSEDHCGAAGVVPLTRFAMTCSTHDVLRDLP